MLRVGVTGGIGSGKSTLTAALAEHGGVVIDADQLARDVLAPGTSGLGEVVRHFGERVLIGDELNRAALAAIVFADATELAALEAITHPRIRHLFEELVAAQPVESIVIHEVPLLAEKALDDQYHLVIGVSVAEPERRMRLLARGMDSADIDRRLAAQLADSERARHCDLMIDNSGAPRDLEIQAATAWNRIAGFHANLLARRPAERDPALVLTPWTAEWVDGAERLIRRLRRTLGDLSIHHIGSTAVPGLSAKDVIDLQVSVPDLRAVEDADFVAAGFAAHAFIDRDNPRSAHPDPEHWRKRYFVSCDPGRAVNLHVRERGSPGERFALLFRDWLRATPEARAAYAELKRHLSDRSMSTAEYAEAKEPWFNAHEQAMETWAMATRWSVPER